MSESKQMLYFHAVSKRVFLAEIGDEIEYF